MTLTLPAFAATVLASIAAVQGSGGIAEEINGGTLEQVQLSPAPPALQALGRLGALAVEGLVAAVVLGVVFALGVGLRYHPSPSATIPAVLTAADALGYGLVLVGLTVRGAVRRGTPVTTRFAVALGNEIRKGLLHAWSERPQILIELPMFATFILLLGPLLGQGQQVAAGHLRWSLDSGRTSVLVVWFIPFVFFYMQVVKMFWRLLGEIQTGTIEQVNLSPLPSWLVVAGGRVVAALVETIFVASATYGIVSVFVPLHIRWSVTALLPAFMIVLTGAGVSLIIAGATLVWKRIQMVNDAVMMIVFLFSAAAVPLITVPGWWAEASNLLPLTSGVASLYRVMFLQQPATSLGGTGGVVSLVGTAAAYLAAGIVAFRLGEQTARRRGTLGRY